MMMSPALAQHSAESQGRGWICGWIGTNKTCGRPDADADAMRRASLSSLPWRWPYGWGDRLVAALVLCPAALHACVLLVVQSNPIGLCRFVGLLQRRLLHCCCFVHGLAAVRLYLYTGPAASTCRPVDRGGAPAVVVLLVRDQRTDCTLRT